ncbi:amidohydrolase family protein [Mesorhizobium sp. B2-8-5]|uniref:amidohydrolase family protein n=1 Tax=Mesorhizobium sp. B2-8-5 TaxID=2589903 RepID=UPI001D030AD8|nr:amidohydrolase family protein [Mesorhizobium sp. B2-8-5]UCI23417.1 amidohydrolase family protein [Mesorhizobium sp. B2-8-5]
MPYDLLIRRATLISGDGSDRFEADIAVTTGRIAAIGRLEDAQGIEEIDAKGKVVAPGFIDVHTHDDGALLAPRGMDPKISRA